jgi:acetolactate synthase-1/2/3 large subunit
MQCRLLGLQISATTESRMSPRASDVFAEFLERKQIRHVFGIIGAGNAHLFDAIGRRNFTEIVCVHHEQAAVMAMGTYFRTCGTVSAALLTTGAGSTNGITGAVSCYMDSIPGLIVCGNENSKFTDPENPLRIWGVQGFDSVAMVGKVVKHAQRVMQADDLLFELEKAYDLCLSGRPGPAWLEVPMNVQATEVTQEVLRHYRPVPRARTSLSKQVAAVIDRLCAAQRPLLWLGHGIRLAGAVPQAAQALQRSGCPALLSWAAADMLSSDHPGVVGRAGVYGQRHANFTLQNCDYLLTIGTRLAMPQVGYDLSELARAANITVVDIDPTELNKFGHKRFAGICADAKDFLEEFNTQLAAQHKSFTPPRWQDWLQTCATYKEQFPLLGPEHADTDGYINSYAFIQRLNALTKDTQIIVTDMGTALLSGHQALHLRSGQRLMTSTGLGEMGFGLPGAIGASFASGRGEVLCLNCDGGMLLNLQELQTIAHHQLPIKIIVFNNQGYLMIKHTQKSLFCGRFTGVEKSSGVSCPDYSKLATAFGFAAYQVRTWEDFDCAMPQFLAGTRPAVCEVFMHPEQPLVPKLGLAVQPDGTIVSPPLEDLLPLVNGDRMAQAMRVGMHPKSLKLRG